MQKLVTATLVLAGSLAAPAWSQATVPLAWRVERSSDVAGHDGLYAVGGTHASPPAIGAR